METLIFANSKGGVGKTHLSYHIAKNLAEKGNRVLCVDLDEQSQLVYLLHVEGTCTLYDVITLNLPIEDAVVKVSNTLYCIYSDVSLRRLEGYLMGSRIGYERVIYKKMLPVLDLFDYVVVDMPPATNLTSMNSYTFPNVKVVIPVLLSLLSIDSMKQMIDTIDEVRDAYSPDLKLGGIVVCRDNIEISKHSHDCMKVLKDNYSTHLFPGSFRHSVHYTNSSLLGQSIREYLEINGIKDKHHLGEEIDNITNYILQS